MGRVRAHREVGARPLQGLLAMTAEEKRARARDLRLRRTYGITAAQYDELLKVQEGRCFICRRLPKKMPLNVDHDHKSGLVRGLLCWTCNHRLLPAAGDDPGRALRAASYLKFPPAVDVIGRIIAP